MLPVLINLPMHLCDVVIDALAWILAIEHLLIILMDDASDVLVIGISRLH